jgi:hypothetical protein
MRRAEPHGVGCEYPQYPAGVTASVLKYSRRSGVPPANPFGGRRRELCAARRVQANTGGLVSFFFGGTGHVSVVGSTLTNISVRAHCRVPSRVPAHRGSRPAAPHR